MADYSGYPARSETWAVAALAAAVLACASLVAVALVLILRQPQGPASASAGAPINANPVINIHTGTAAAAAPATEAAKPGALVRADRQVSGQMARPLPLADQKVFLRVREGSAASFRGTHPLPMPAVRRADGQVEGIYASRDAAPAAPQPDRAYGDTGASGAGLELQLFEPRSTHAIDGYQAPAGFSFFTGRLLIRNRSAQPVALDLDALELRDSEGAIYLANPELSGALPGDLLPGQEAETALSFLVSDQAPLSALALQTEGAPVQLLLARR